MKMKKGFTLIEMLVVMGIIAVLIGASIAAFSRVTKTAEKARAQELVSNTATALTALFQKEGSWPKALASNGGSDGLLNVTAIKPLSTGNYMSLNLNGYDKFGIVTPWAVAAIKRAGTSASLSTHVGTLTVQDHILHYALDLDGDGVLEANVGGESVSIRATAAVWCIGKSGGNRGTPWPYSEGRKGGKKDDVYSWSYGQTQNVK